MGKAIVLDLGPANDLNQRLLVIRNTTPVPPTTVYSYTLAGNVEQKELDELPDGGMFEALLTDRRAGVDGETSVLKFSTGHLGPKFKSGELKILSWEDTSSSSSLSSLSSSSSSRSSSSLSSLSSQSSSASSSSSSSQSSGTSLSSESSSRGSSLSSASSLSSSSSVSSSSASSYSSMSSSSHSSSSQS